MDESQKPARTLLRAVSLESDEAFGRGKTRWARDVPVHGTPDSTIRVELDSDGGASLQPSELARQVIWGEMLIQVTPRGGRKPGSVDSRKFGLYAQIVQGLNESLSDEKKRYDAWCEMSRRGVPISEATNRKYYRRLSHPD